MSSRSGSRENDTPSLFVVALPRTLSTVVYHVARLALRLDQPAWTSDGEILNNDRFSLYGGPTEDSGVKYVHPSADPERFQSAIAFLDDVTRAEGRAYKDVVQPFAVAAWLPASGLRVLRVRRPVADVAFAMLRRNWLYAARAAAVDVHPGSAPDLQASVIDGLLHADQALDTLPGEAVDYDALIEDESVLHEALLHLYPGLRVPRFRYIDASFRRVRESVLARREDDTFREIERLVHDRRIALAASSAPSREPQPQTDLTPA